MWNFVSCEPSVYNKKDNIELSKFFGLKAGKSKTNKINRLAFFTKILKNMTIKNLLKRLFVSLGNFSGGRKGVI